MDATAARQKLKLGYCKLDLYSLNCILAGLDNPKGEEAIGLLRITLKPLTTLSVTLYNSSSSFVGTGYVDVSEPRVSSLLPLSARARNKGGFHMMNSSSLAVA